MANGKAYIICRPVNAGVELHLLADPAISRQNAVSCLNAVACKQPILVMRLRRLCQNALIDIEVLVQ